MPAKSVAALYEQANLDQPVVLLLVLDDPGNQGARGSASLPKEE